VPAALSQTFVILSFPSTSTPLVIPTASEDDSDSSSHCNPSEFNITDKSHLIVLYLIPISLTWIKSTFGNQIAPLR
jgi:hypothetical protein